jgi:nitrite reductase (NO-forming)
MSRIGFAIVGLSLAGVLVSSACGASTQPGSAAASAAPASGAQQVTVNVGNSMSFDPTTITVHSGQPIQLTLHNSGVMPHDFSLNQGVAQPVKISVGGGQTASGVFTIDAPGTYTFECSMPGHAAAGMHGTITAE